MALSSSGALRLRICGRLRNGACPIWLSLLVIDLFECDFGFGCFYHRRVDLGVKITELDESVNVRRSTEKKKIR